MIQNLKKETLLSTPPPLSPGSKPSLRFYKIEIRCLQDPRRCIFEVFVEEISLNLKAKTETLKKQQETVQKTKVNSTFFCLLFQSEISFFLDSFFGGNFLLLACCFLLFLSNFLGFFCFLFFNLAMNRSVIISY